MTRTRLHVPDGGDPSFGWDPWLNGATRPDPEKLPVAPGLARARVSASAPFYYGADATGDHLGDIEPLVNHGYRMFASYETASGWGYGNYPKLAADMAGIPGIFLLSYTVDPSGRGAAHAADVEPRAMVASQLPDWYDNHAIWSPGLSIPYPWMYASASNMASCNAAIGARKVVRISAHYGFGWHVCGPGTCGWPQADWTQCFDTGPNGENYDRNIGLVLPVAITPPTPEEIMDTALAQNAQGVLHYFALGAEQTRLWYTWQDPSSNAWEGGKAGVRVALLEPFAVAPDGLKFEAVSAAQDGQGDLHVVAQCSDGRSVYCWQKKGENAWSHKFGPMANLAPAPGHSTF